MPVTIDATSGGAAANSYETLLEFQTYLGLRLNLPAAITALIVADPTEKLPKALIMATRGLDQILTKFRRLEILESRNKMEKFYVTRPHWTGTPSTTTQTLAWPRTSMLSRNGVAIDSTVIPQELKDAESEFALTYLSNDPTADNSIIVQGIKDLKAGPVELQFKDYIQKRLLPDYVLQCLVPTWLTDELVESIPQARFNTLGRFGRFGRC